MILILIILILVMMMMMITCQIVVFHLARAPRT